MFGPSDNASAGSKVEQVINKSPKTHKKSYPVSMFIIASAVGGQTRQVAW